MAFLSYIGRKLDAGPGERLALAARRYLAGRAPSRSGDMSACKCVDEWTEAACRTWQVTIEEVAYHGAYFLGKLRTTPSGFRLSLRDDLRGTRRRFVQAHELAHIVACEPGDPGPRRRVPLSPQEEAFCDQVARELLLPDEWISTEGLTVADVKGATDFTRLRAVAAEYGVFDWQLVKGLLERDMDDASIGILWLLRRPQQYLEICDWIAPPGVFIPRGKRLRIGTTLDHSSEGELGPAMAAMSGKVVCRAERMDVGTVRGELETISFPVQRSALYVMQVVNLSSDIREKARTWRARRSLVVA